MPNELLRDPTAWHSAWHATGPQYASVSFLLLYTEITNPSKAQTDQNLVFSECLMAGWLGGPTGGPMEGQMDG